MSVSILKNEICFGSSFKITDEYKYKSLEIGLITISVIGNLYNNQFEFNNNNLNRLYGNQNLTNFLNSAIQSERINLKYSISNFLKNQENDLQRFITKSSKYYLYD